MGKKSKHILCSKTSSESRALYEITWENMVRRMRIACCIPKATNTHSQHAILIAFPRQKWLRERASILHSYVHCLSCSILSKCDERYFYFYRNFATLQNAHSHTHTHTHTHKRAHARTQTFYTNLRKHEVRKDGERIGYWTSRSYEHCPSLNS